ncbi:MAG: hypothetical protein ACRDRP_21620 [Pseudonocardiaceae bacterium]
MDGTAQDRQIPAQLCRAMGADRAADPALPVVADRNRRRAGVRRVRYQLTSAELIRAGVSAELLALLALRRAVSGRVAKSGEHYYDYGHPMPSHLTQILDELTEGGFVTLARGDVWGMRRLGLTDVGHARYVQLSGLGLAPGYEPDRSARW